MVSLFKINNDSVDMSHFKQKYVGMQTNTTKGKSLKNCSIEMQAISEGCLGGAILEFSGVHMLYSEAFVVWMHVAGGED